VRLVALATAPSSGEAVGRGTSPIAAANATTGGRGHRVRVPRGESRRFPRSFNDGQLLCLSYN
jgi:hypothetical protein